jgi:hypothetical protein
VLTKRFQLIDLLSGVFIAATIAAVCPGVLPAGRMIIFLATTAVSAPSTWWGVSISDAHSVSSSMSRVLINLYAFVSFVSLLVFIPFGSTILFLAIFVTLTGDGLRYGDDGFLASSVLPIVISGALSFSMLLVERGRRRAVLRTDAPSADLKIKE